MDDFLSAYQQASGVNERYQLLRSEAKRLRQEARDRDFRQSEDVHQILADANQDLEGSLIAFCANDFGWPVAFRPEGMDPERQDLVRRWILEGKYEVDEDLKDLQEVQTQLMDADPRIHKVLVAEVDAEEVRYFLPEGKSEASTFLMVREPLGLIDWTTHSRRAANFQVEY